MSTATLEPKWSQYSPVDDPEAPFTRLPGWEDVSQRLKVALAKLAEFITADQVAEFLRGHDIKGVVGDSGRCPLATYLQHAVGHHEIRCNYSTTALFLNGDYLTSVSFRTPPVMRAFYGAFDSNAYPDLITDTR